MGLCGGGIVILSKSVPGEETFALNNIVSSREVDLVNKNIYDFYEQFYTVLLGP